MIFTASRSADLREELITDAKTIRLLPSLNTITARLLHVMNDPDSSFNELFDVARHDQAFSSKIMSIANSAFYSRSCTILSLQRALHVIGIEELRKLLICLMLLQDILKQWRLSQDDLAAIWTHSLRVSCAARTLSVKQMVEDPEEVFTVAMLHDIGKGVFYAKADRYRELVEEAVKTGKDLCGLERLNFGTDHQEVGDFISRKWRFPKDLAAVIRSHHTVTDDGNGFLHVVSVADAFVENRDCDLGAEGIILDEERESIAGEVQRISELLGIVATPFSGADKE